MILPVKYLPSFLVIPGSAVGNKLLCCYPRQWLKMLNRKRLNMITNIIIFFQSSNEIAEQLDFPSSKGWSMAMFKGDVFREGGPFWIKPEAVLALYPSPFCFFLHKTWTCRNHYFAIYSSMERERFWETNKIFKCPNHCVFSFSICSQAHSWVEHVCVLCDEGFLLVLPGISQNSLCNLISETLAKWPSNHPHHTPSSSDLCCWTRNFLLLSYLDCEFPLIK